MTSREKINLSYFGASLAIGATMGLLDEGQNFNPQHALAGSALAASLIGVKHAMLLVREKNRLERKAEDTTDREYIAREISSKRIFVRSSKRSGYAAGFALAGYTIAYGVKNLVQLCRVNPPLISL